MGFEFRKEGRGRVWNTFDTHRLLHWAGLQGQSQQLALKKALLGAYFTHARCMSDHEVLVGAAVEAGLDAEAARAMLASDAFEQEVRAQEKFYTQAGIHSVPAVIINDQHLISGGQRVEVFEQALREIAASAQR